MNIPQEDIDEAIAGLEAAQLDPAAFTGVDFCKAWPMVKSVLQVLAAVPALKFIVPIVISIGDRFHATKCPR